MNYVRIYKGGPIPYQGRGFILWGGPANSRTWDIGVFQAGQYKFASDDEFPGNQDYFTHWAYVDHPRDDEP